jgi:hypothetical protein
MPWTTIAQVVGSAVGVKALLGGDQSSGDAGAARTAAGSSARYYDQLAQIGGEQWNLFKEKALPLLDQLKGQSTLNEADYVNKAADDVKTQYGVARANLQRNLELSRSPADPATGAILAPTYMDEASQTAGAIQNARRYVNEESFRRTGQVAGMYAGFPASASSALGGATSGAINTARTYGNLSADAATRQAQAAYGGFNLAGNAARWFGSQSAQPNPSANYRLTDPTMIGSPTTYGDPYSLTNPAYGADGGIVRPRYDDGGAIFTRDGPMPMGSGRDPHTASLAQPAAGGGVIRGPGTGTSDSIPTRARPGSYILSADTVRAIGTKKVRDMIEQSGVRPGEGGHGYTGVPIRVSSGEAEIPPETTAHYGTAFFDKLQQRYHRPIFSDSGAVNGGVIRTRGLPHSVEQAIFHELPARAIGHSRR